jgi:hypothetical protein
VGSVELVSLGCHCPFVPGDQQDLFFLVSVVGVNPSAAASTPCTWFNTSILVLWHWLQDVDGVLWLQVHQQVL